MSFKKLKQVYSEHSVDQTEICDNVIDKAAASNKSFIKRHHLKLTLTTCLCLLILTGGFSGSDISIKAKEYMAAVEFLDQNDLPVEGLSRINIKMAYKDMIIGTYSYDKGIEISNTISAEAYSIKLETVSKEELDTIWSNKNHVSGSYVNVKHKNGIHYEATKSDEKIDELFNKTVITKYENASVHWTYTIQHDLPEAKIIECNKGVIVYGNATEYNGGNWFGVILLIDNNGKLVWEESSSIGSGEYDIAVLGNKKISVFGHRISNENKSSGKDRPWHFTFTEYDLEGNKLLYKEQYYGKYHIASAVAGVEDYYLVKLRVYSGNGVYGDSEVISVSHKGEITDKFTYSADGKAYTVQDIILYNGKVYLSALISSMSRDAFDKEFTGLLTRYYKALEEQSSTSTAYEAKMPQKYKVKLRELFKKQYSAALLVCDTNMVVNKVFSVDKARSGSLSVSDEGKLVWRIMRIDDAINSPAGMSSCRVFIAATEFLFTFDEAGKIIKKSEIGPYSMRY